MERSKAGTKNEVQRPYSSGLSQAYLPPGLLRPEEVDEFLNYSTPIVHPLPLGGNNINKHKIVIFYKHGKSVMKFS